MKKSIHLFALIISLLFTLSSCKQDEPRTINPVSQFVYDGLSTYYLWSEGMTSIKPTINDQNPEVYFESLLNGVDKNHGWSFITDDVQSLLADFSGEPVDFGYSLTFAYANDAKTEYYAIIKYIFPNSPASNAGLQRLDIISQINGLPITEKNYGTLYGSSAVNLTINNVTSSGLVFNKTVIITPAKINTDPVLYKHIYDINGKKIAYLFYTGFIPNYNSSLYTAFSEFKQAGVTDLILDLRYNHGGAITAATYLSSMIAPKTVVRNKSPFAIMSYNNFLNSYFDKEKWSRTDSLGVYESTENDPINANIDLQKIYIIATDDSYSAAELTTFCLKSYMDVVHIGGTTGGKYTASWTIHPYDDTIGVPAYDVSKLSTKEKDMLKNWAMQPIVAKYTNNIGEDFSNSGYLVPDYALDEGFGYISKWTQIGDTKDTYLGQAIYLITGDESYKPVLSVPMNRIKMSGQAAARLNDPKDIAKEAVILDNNRMPKDFLKTL
ncbi:MAG: S41 family peptidase [Paludibacteraceae bacterium]